MANRDLKVNIDGDPRGFIAAAKRAAAEARKLESELDRMNKKRDLGDLGSDAVADAQKAFKGLFSDISSLGPASVGVLAAAIVALPATASLAAAGVTAALGGGLAAVGLVAAAQSARVKGEFADLADDVGDSLQDVAAPLETSLLKSTDVARRAFASLEPELESAFGKLAPKIDSFVARVGDGVAQMEPALDPLADGFGALLDAVGGRSTAIFGNLEDAVTSLAETTERHAEDIAAVVEGISAAIKGGADAAGWLADEWDRALGEWEPIAEYFTGTEQDLNNSGAAVQRATQAAIDGATKWADLGRSMDSAKVAADGLRAELDGLNASMDEDEAASRYQEALDRAAESIKRNGHALSINTEKGRSNRDAIRDMARAAQDHIVALANEGATVGTVSGVYSGYRSQLASTLRQAGATKAEAKALTDQWLRVPKSVTTTARANTAQAFGAIGALINRVQALPSGKTITVTYVQRGPGLTGRPLTSYLPGHATGGMVRGPGSGTSDDVPILASNGEFVINARSTARHRELLEAINAGKFAQGGIVGRYASGGMVGATAPISEFVSRFMDGKPLSKSDYAKVVRSHKDAIAQLRTAERKLADDRKKHKSAKTIADDEARVAKERRDLATATDKLSEASARYNKSKLTPVQRLGAGLTLGIKNTAAFIKNITALADRGFGALAQSLLAAGGPDAEAMAASAVKLSASKLKTLNAQVVTAGKQQAKLDALPNILAVKEAQKGGAKSVKDLMRVTGLSEEDIAAAFAAMGYARGGIERYARGGRRPGPGIATRPTVLFGEGRAPEAFIPYDRAHRTRAMGLVNQVAADLGMRRGGGSVTHVYNVTVQGAIDPIGTARTVETALRKLSRTNGRVPLAL